MFDAVRARCSESLRSAACRCDGRRPPRLLPDDSVEVARAVVEPVLAEHPAAGCGRASGPILIASLRQVHDALDSAARGAYSAAA